MTNVTRLTAPGDAYDEASEWIARLDRKLAAGEKHELEAWLARAPRNRRRLLELAALWEKMDSLRQLSEICPRRPPRSRSFKWTALAASIAAVAAVGLFVLGEHPAEAPSVAVPSQPQPAYDTYETAIGEQSSVSLPDGSRLTANTNTRIRVRFTAAHRLLFLERGELHLQVAKDPARPLSVIAGDKVIQATGTAFNVEISSEQKIVLLVTEGSVRVGVYHPSGGGTGDEPEPLADDSVTVSAGEETLLGAPAEELETIETDELEVRLSWRAGNLIFRGEPLEEAVAEVSRYTAVEFVILDERAKKLRVAGLFRAGDVEGLLAALEQNFNVSYQRVSDNKIVLRGE